MRAERRTPFKPKPNDRTARDAARTARQLQLDAEIDLPADYSPYAVCFLDRDGQTCRWPLNEVMPIAEHMVCNAACEHEDDSYCPRHYQLSTQPYRPRVSDAERELRAAIKNNEQTRTFGGR